MSPSSSLSRFLENVEWSHAGSSTPMPTEALQGYLDGLADGRYQMPLDRVFRFDEIQAAHACMEANQAVGKIVVSVV